MNYEEFNQFCRALPATTHIVQWGGAQVWKVGVKLFAIGGCEAAGKPACSFRTPDLDFHYLADQPGYRPAPCLASRGLKWIRQSDAPASEADELEYYLRVSHRLVSRGLTRKLQTEFGLKQQDDKNS